MLIATRSFTALLGYFLLIHSVALGADLFQWTDANGVIHFTDNSFAVPESVRRSANLIVRPDFLSPSAPSGGGQGLLEQLPAAKPEVSQPSPLLASEPGPPTFVTYAPQEVTIVVVNSSVQQPGTKSCVGDNCKRGFRPDFNHRWHVHPRVFAGGSRQFIRP